MFQVLDETLARKMLENLPERSVAVILNAFEDGLMGRMQEMHRARDACDVVALHAAAQSLAGMASTFGAQQVATMARLSLQADEASPAPELLDNLQDAVLVATLEMSELFQSRLGAAQSVTV